MTDPITTDDGRCPVTEKDGIIGVELRESIRVTRFERKGELLLRRFQLVVDGHELLLAILDTTDRQTEPDLGGLTQSICNRA
jgi:hypothetical protein